MLSSCSVFVCKKNKKIKYIKKKKRKCSFAITCIIKKTLENIFKLKTVLVIILLFCHIEGLLSIRQYKKKKIALPQIVSSNV